MHRNTVNRSVSFNPELFGAMDAYCRERFLSRSEYIQRLIIQHLGKDAKNSPELSVGRVPDTLISETGKKYKHKAKPQKGRNSA